MDALDLFAGAGGMSLGAKLAGVNVIEAVEYDKYAGKTYSLNFPHVKLFADSIENYTGERDGFKPVLIFGGPPCRGFSTSNQRTRNQTNKNNWLFLEYIRVVTHFLPEWVVLENVKGLMETEKGLFLNLIVKSLQELGYKVQYSILNASDYGVPQSRNRLFVVGNRCNRVFIFPKPIKARKITVAEAIGDLSSLENGSNESWQPYKKCTPSSYAKKIRNLDDGCENNIVTKNSKQIIERYKHIPQGGNWKNIPSRLMKNYKDYFRCHTGIYHRLKNDTPSVVLGNFRKNMLIHPEEHRGISVREAARLQSFPDWFIFDGSIGFQQQQVGNAVPPLLARVIFKQIINS